MTPEQIDALQPGPELDLLVCDYVMKWTRSLKPDAKTGPFSTKIEYAWLVIKEISKRGKSARFGEFFDQDSPWKWYLMREEALCANVCRAALKVVGVPDLSHGADGRAIVIEGQPGQFKE